MRELTRIPLFEHFGRAELEQLAAIVKRRTYAPDTVVFFEGDPSDALYALLSGAAKVTRTAEDGTAQIVSTLAEGDVFGEYALIDGEPRSASVTTLSKCEMLSLTHREFRALVSRSPEVLWTMMQSLTKRMRTQNQELLQLTCAEVPRRLLTVLSRLASRHGDPVGAGRRISFALRPSDLAGMIASTSARVDRLLLRFEGEGLIVRTGAGGRSQDGDAPEHIFVPDLEALRRANEYAPDGA